MKKATTLGALKKSGYKSRSVKEELRDNLIAKLRKNETVFPGILGFENTVLPDVERAVLSRHNILLLGLRGQAKTRIARLLTNLLDEWMPIIEGSELNDDPLNPISRYGIDKVAELGDKTPVAWVHRDDRYVEKLATPDVSIADLVGDVDPIKAATLKLPYSDERVIHFGLIPRSHRCLFVINELPDLQARIQVSLFNILQEGDMQIRGFKLRLPLDIQFLFTANPEDYTNRGSIITPLKDRIESQILTHYPQTVEIAKSITSQEANLAEGQQKSVYIPEILKTLMEYVSFAARDSELVDEASGVSARLSISGIENLASAAERRMHLNGEKSTTARISDFWGVVPAITGKVELVYEGEQEGPQAVAVALLSSSIKQLFLDYFENPSAIKKGRESDVYGVVRAWFSGGNILEIFNDDSDKEFKKALDQVAGLSKLVKGLKPGKKDEYIFKELLIHGLAEHEIVGKEMMDSKTSFSDLLAGMLGDDDDDLFKGY